ncbi:hypothetical protein GCM10009122_35440 [Fulvivirga kasyanovii]|uniref:Linalool dehydratase/isomerase domain-containing protein n=1 Tax=Fulvivirga kasyanovii TaxID=396812 RepID=A0ABW9RI38_9BACT|nr:hypothetical protein [Fulvivirga kasyanovii]MTI23653.1 hypothetical protein [Fulvivirga kasyanovii]
MKVLLKILLSVPLLIILYFAFSISHKLYYSPCIDENGINRDLYAQLNYLNLRKADHAAEEMQYLYPEGLMFFECLYGLAWTDFLTGTEYNSEIFQDGLREIDKSLAATNSEAAKSIFQGKMLLTYGAFYNGWNNYLLGRKLEIIPQEKWSDVEINKFKVTCANIARALNSSSTPYLESYTNASWPADMVVCIASLALHDRLFEDKYTALIQNWLENVKQKQDQNGLIPHAVDAADGAVIEGARGSSQSLILSFLPEIDSSYSHHQYKLFKQLFIQKRLGLSAILEYPNGKTGKGDIDSGPVIWGIGPAATIVAHRAAIKHDDLQLAIEIRNTIEAFGFPETVDNKKYFLNGYLDIADAFIAWTRAANPSLKSEETEWWQLNFHLWSMIIISPVILGLFLIWRKRK